jgi:hypothetical protein
MSGRGVGWLAVAAGCMMAIAGSASAAPGMANKVYDPYVRNGVTEVEVRGGRLLGGQENGDSAAIVEVEHGFNDRFSLAVVGEFEDEPGARRKLDSVALEGVVYVGQIPGLGVDVGLYGEYEQRIHNESGVGEAKVLMARQMGPVHTSLNIIVRQAFTDRDGEGAMTFGYAAQGVVEVAPRFFFGAQAFGDIGQRGAIGGRQGHFAGPVIRYEFRNKVLPGEIEVEGAYLFPLGTAKDETDGQVRFAVEWEKRF